MVRIKTITGTMDVGRGLDEAQTRKMLEMCLKQGITEFDSAYMYANGESEKILGRIAIHHDQPLIAYASKANPSEDFDEAAIRQQLDTSLERLGVRSLDIFYLHWPSKEVSIEETLAAIGKLHFEGKFKEFGLSNYSAWEVAHIVHVCRNNGWVEPTVYQGMYNAFTRDVERELFPCLRKFGIRFYAYNPLAGGLLTGRYKVTDIENFPEDTKCRFFGVGGHRAILYRERFWKREFFDGCEAVREALDTTYGSGHISPAEAALRWLACHSQLRGDCGDGIILGASKLEQWRMNLDVIADPQPLADSIVAVIDRAWGQIKGTCPQYSR